MSDEIFIKSHVARDFLQNAALFKTDKLAIWEYVANGLQYSDPQTSPEVHVHLDNKAKSITISDNGRGMSWPDLQNFFVMHGENQDRKVGRAGRGRFGTGKCAAFGIAETLRISTVRDGKQSIVELSRDDVAAMSSDDPVPVRAVERMRPVKESNGTLIEIGGVRLRSLDQTGIVRYIEKHLARWSGNVRVYVNNHECEYMEPPIERQQVFLPNAAEKAVLGNVTLTVKVSKIPLDPDERGISISSKGIWHETTLAGSEGRDLSQYIFGDIDVPRLEEDDSVPGPFDLSRSMRLSQSNALVQSLFAFIGRSIENVRVGLVEAQRRRRQTEENEKLADEAREIAKIINQDFIEFRARVARSRGVTDQGGDSATIPGGGTSPGEVLQFGGREPVDIVSPEGAPGSDGGERSGGEEPRLLRPIVSGGNEADAGRKTEGKSSARKPSGGFQVLFENLGDETPRAFYEREKRTIFINLDHPQVFAARSQADNIDDISFRRLAYEVALTEYAIVLAQELAMNSEYIDPSDPIYDIRDTINRLARKAAALYLS